MKVIFSSLAKLELNHATNYYELEYKGLGLKFKEEAYKVILRISEHPMAWSIDLGDIRKCMFHRFPFKVLYSIESNHIFIIAIAHQHRKPEYWIDRNKNS